MLFDLFSGLHQKSPSRGFSSPVNTYIPYFLIEKNNNKTRLSLCSPHQSPLLPPNAQGRGFHPQYTLPLEMSTENCIICKPCDPRSPSPLQLFTMVCTVPQPSLLAVAVLPSALCRVAGLLLYECFLFLLRLRRDPEVSAQLPLLFLTLS